MDIRGTPSEGNVQPEFGCDLVGSIVELPYGCCEVCHDHPKSAEVHLIAGKNVRLCHEADMLVWEMTNEQRDRLVVLIHESGDRFSNA